MDASEAGAIQATVLIVEDHALMRNTVRNYLKSVFPRINVLVAANAVHALALCAAQPPHLVLMDIGLPDANGIELTAQLKAQLPQLKVIIVSQYAAQPYVSQALAAGAVAYVHKDRLFSDLTVQVALALTLPDTASEEKIPV